MATSGGPDIVNDGLVLHTDRYNHKFRSDSYNALNIKRPSLPLARINNSSFSVPHLDAVDSNNIQRFTVAVWLQINSYITGYAWHPINKWNSGGTSSASIVLYAFGDWRSAGGGYVEDGLGNNAHGNYGFYFHAYGVGWGGITTGTNNALLGGISSRNDFPRKNFFVLTYDVNQNSSKPKMYLNGQYHNQWGSAPDGLGNYTHTQQNMTAYTNYPNDSSSNINGVTWLQCYDRMLSDEEILNLYDKTKVNHGY